MGNWQSWEFTSGLITAYTEDGFLGVQADAFGGEEAEIGGAAVMHPFGFASRPKSATDGVGAHFLVFQPGSAESFAIPLHDPRSYSRVPALTEGSSVQYGDWGGFAQFDEETNTYTIYVPDGPTETATKAHLVQVGVDANGKRVVNFIMSDGQSILMQEGKGVIIRADKNTRIEMKPGVGGAAGKIFLIGDVKVIGSFDCAYGSTGLPVLIGSPPGAPSTTMRAL